MPSQEKLQALAELTIKCGIGLMPGQEMILYVDINDAPLARLVIAEAYKAGAKSVTTFWIDEQSTLIRFDNGSDEAIAYAPSWLPNAIAEQLNDRAAYLRIASANPSLLKNVDPAKVATSSKAQSIAGKSISEAITTGACNWCIVPAASKAWAKQVFPNDEESQAIEKLWDLIFHCTRSDQPDPVAAWNAHCEQVGKRMKRMNEAKFDSLHFTGPGTDFTVGLVEGHIWEGVTATAKNGATCSPNIPTEEIFSMPHRARVNGTVRSTKPLSLRGQIVDGISMTFVDGVATQVSAEKGEETLVGLLNTDEGARRLGEIAIVPHNSPISQSGITFFNTLFDENASCHIAMGQCYGTNLEGFENMTEEEKLAAGANDSMIHVDWMIGSDQVNLDGIMKDGTRVPLMRGCEWVD
ncbi:MAG TPA: aminopeptidase [Fimbriimonas sp.]|nr:aminopeptidase [Fimbriimonas sp.]